MFLFEEGNINRYILRYFPHSMGYIKACNLPVCVSNFKSTVLWHIRFFVCFVYVIVHPFILAPSFFSACQTVHLFEKRKVNRYFLWDFSSGVGYFPAHSLPFCVSIMVLLQCDLGCQSQYDLMKGHM